MKRLIKRLGTDNAIYMLWIFLCFALTSAVYLSWLDRLVLFSGSPATDWISMVAGYLFQAAGMGTVIFLLHRKQLREPLRSFTSTVLLFTVIMIPLLITDSIPLIICFGSLMNYFCGIIAGFYLYGISLRIDEKRRSLVFGGGYAAATILVGLLALIGMGSLLHGKLAIPLYLVMTAGLLYMTSRLDPFRLDETDPDSAREKPAKEEPAKKEPAMAAAAKEIPAMAASSKIISISEAQVKETSSTKVPQKAAHGKADLLLLSCIIVILISMVKNLGFGFPSSDIQAGLIPEISRIPYAAGLAAAGFVNDKNRKNGMMCTVAALIIPFIMLGLVGEPLSRTIFWGMDYLFFGFFSVFRVVLFLDLADQSHCPELAPLGLVMGRIGDAAGTAVCLLLADNKLALIIACTLLFFPTIFLLFRLFQILYEPEAVHQKTEQEVFETFCLHNDLSSREKDIFRMIISNRTNGEIAEALFISENTVKYHVRNLLQKTGCKNRTELQKKYMMALYPGMESAATGQGS